MRVRLIAAPLILLLILGVLWLHGATGSAVGTHILLAVFGAVAGAEMALLIRNAGRPARPLEAAIACGVLCLSGLVITLTGAEVAAVLLILQPWLLFAFVLYLLVAHLFETRPEGAESIAFRLVPILYVGFLLSWMSYFTIAPTGWDIAWVVLTAKASDMAGWLIGVPFGKHKMIPSVSPGKSWEGTFAGLAASVLVAVFLPGLLGIHAAGWSLGWRIGFGLAVGAASILAGVTWSGWKRRLGAKDSSALLPEMGGVMDMVDSLLLAGPTAILIYEIVPPVIVV